MEKIEKRVLIVFNTCAPNPGASTYHWHKTFDNVLRQNLNGFTTATAQVDTTVDYVISDCMSAANHLSDVRALAAKAKTAFHGRRACVSLLKVKAGLPVSFNYACKKMTALYGHYDYYVMWPSDVYFNDVNSLTNLLAVFDAGDIGIVSPSNIHDLPLGDGSWAGYSRYDPNGGVVHLPVGAACNGVFLIFGGEMAKKYNYKPWYDLLQTFCTESMLSFQAAAIKMKWACLLPVKVETAGYGKDGPCLLYRDTKSGAVIPAHTFNENYDLHKIVEEGYDVGLGFEELHKVHMHNPDCYDGLFAKTNKLYEYILKNLYIKTKDFNYNKASNGEFYEI